MPALRWLWKDGAVGAVVDFLENTRMGSRASAEMTRARVDEDRGHEDAWGSEGEEECSFPLFFLCHFQSSLCLAGSAVGEGVAPV